MDEDKWLTLQDDLLVDIFRLLDATAVIRCAAACRPWRRAIIDNASCLHPRPGDRFFPGLLLGFLEKNMRMGLHHLIPWLHYVPASNTTPVPAFFTPTRTSCISVVIDGKMYGNLLSSRDGLLLLGHKHMFGEDDSLCLCTVHTGDCRVVPAAAIHTNFMSPSCMYDILVTGDGDETAAVWMILAVTMWLQDNKDTVVSYQVFSSTSGAWGPVKCSSPKLPDGMNNVYDDPSCHRGVVVVCHGVVSWFVHLVPNHDAPDPRTRMCMFSIDLRTERTWTTELPRHLGVREDKHSLVMAVSEDGQVSLVRMLSFSHKIEVWVLVGDGGGQWTLRRRFDDVQKLLPNCPSLGYMRISGFCSTSGYLFGHGLGYRDLQQHFVIGIDGSSPRLIGTAEFPSSNGTRFPYEMDWSSYISSNISKTKYL